MSRTDDALPPYAALLGIIVEPAGDADRAPTLRMEFTHALEGRPGMLHGGSTAGLLEMAAQVALNETRGRDGAALQSKPIGITIDYMRPGLPRPTFARGRVTRVGSRVATVIVEAWQTSPAEPIALARLHMLLRPATRDGEEPAVQR
jgi:uncharacterized protein (TIGR00369 family)